MLPLKAQYRAREQLLSEAFLAGVRFSWRYSKAEMVRVFVEAGARFGWSKMEAEELLSKAVYFGWTFRHQAWPPSYEELEAFTAVIRAGLEPLLQKAAA